jgi:hypothetical protein
VQIITKEEAEDPEEAYEVAVEEAIAIAII